MIKKIIFSTGILCCLFLANCSPDRTGEFSYEIIKGEKHIEVTKANLINLLKLNRGDLENLLIALNYEVGVKFQNQNELSYIQKVDSISGVYQIVSLMEAPNKILKVSWVSFDKKDRFAKFIQAIPKDGDLVMKSNETFILNDHKRQYMASIQDVVIGRVISIMEMK